MRKKWIWGVGAGLSCLLGMALYATIQIHDTRMIPAQEIHIPQGASSKHIARILRDKHIISSPFLFVSYSRLADKASRLKPGVYRLEGELSMADILDILVEGEVQRFKVTVPEGLRTDDMLQLLSQHTGTPLQGWKKALATLVGNSEHEGLFLPETYIYTKPLQPKTLLTQMYQARAKVEAKLAQELGWDDAQIMRNRIMASIIEKETAKPRERALVSAVIHNRLKKHMPLQMDPTVIYGIYRTRGVFDGNIRRKDLKADTPWNTYTNKGLPPTPICNPGKASLEAAAYPADVDYLYFVADGTGGHAFASTLEEHNANVQRWIRIERHKHREQNLIAK